jgi:hypothetical protein
MNYERDPVFGCLLAQGRTDRFGYVFWGKSLAHVVAWERVHGQRPEGMEIDHLCRRRNCVAIHHLQLVTRSENEKRKSMKYRMRWKCPKGHDWPTSKVMTNQGGIVCRQCNREAAHE